MKLFCTCLMISLFYMSRALVRKNQKEIKEMYASSAFNDHLAIDFSVNHGGKIIGDYAINDFYWKFENKPNNIRSFFDVKDKKKILNDLKYGYVGEHCGDPYYQTTKYVTKNPYETYIIQKTGKRSYYLLEKKTCKIVVCVSDALNSRFVMHLLALQCS